MNYTCKKCCSIFKEQLVCPICKKEDQVIPIEINVQGNSKRKG